MLPDRLCKTAYFAGIIDGEGSIGFWSSAQGHRRRLCLKISMPCQQTITALQQHFGCGTVVLEPRQKPKNFLRFQTKELGDRERTLDRPFFLVYICPGPPKPAPRPIAER